MVTYEIKTDKKDGHEYIEITGYETSVAHLNVPGEIDGIKVEAIGNHSFSGRSDIVQVTLPDSIRTLYGFAFHNCRNLKKISLYDSIDDYYDGVCRQCDSLRDIEIVLKRGWYEVVRNFLADFDGNLRFKLTLPDGEKALLMSRATSTTLMRIPWPGPYSFPSQVPGCSTESALTGAL